MTDDLRPRERFLSHGPNEFTDVELIALLLGTGSGGRTVLDIAGDLVGRFGSLVGIARAETADLARVPGVGPVRAIRIRAAVELGRRALQIPVGAAPVLSARDAWERLGPGLTGLADEELHALYLDRRRQVLGWRRLTRGSDGFTVVDPRQVFRPAVGLGASAVILAHNHPSGDPTPSAQDREVTRRVADGGRILGIPLLDHLVIGAGRYTSLAAEGLLPAWTPVVPWTSDN